MFANYLKIAWRNLLRNKTFSIINIAGLSIGLSCFMLIMVYVMDELSYDRNFANSDRIYRINADIRFGGLDMHLPVTSDMMGQLLKKDYPQIEQTTRIYTSDGAKLIKKGNSFIKENNVASVDSTFFQIFSLHAISGDLKTALSEPNTVVISESAAKKYYGTTEVIGRNVEINDTKKTIYKITAVIIDIPQNCHFHFAFLFSMKNVDYNWGSLTSHNFHTYLLLKKGTDYKAFEKHFDQYLVKYVLPDVKQFIQINNMDEFKKAGNKLEYTLIPLTKIHLYSDRSFEISPGGNIQYVYIFSGVAFFILIIACINFMNLTTARCANRAREVGIRKVLGSARSSLIAQFLTECTVLVTISFALALVMALVVLPIFNQMAGKSMSFSNLFSPAIIMFLLVLPFAVGGLAGSYPAFFLSAFRPIDVLKGKLSLGTQSGGLRSALVVFQFTSSLVLIIGTIVVGKQLQFIQTKDLGFDRDQVLVIDDAYALKNNATAFKQSVIQLAGIQSGTLSSYLPVTNSSRTDQTYSKDAVMDVKNGLDMQTWYIDYDYLKTMGMQVLVGRNFSKDFPSDSNAVIINESAARFLGYPDPTGQKIYELNNGKTISYSIIGVVKNFNYETLHSNVGPLCFFMGRQPDLAEFKINSTGVKDLVEEIAQIWKKMAPGMPFSYRFLNQSFDEMYRAEQRMGQITMVFSVLAIVVACLGLFGLSAFVAEQRTKEIGIRKVLGASVPGILKLLSLDFVKLVAIAFVISAPLAWYAMHEWLSDFAYRVNISWWIYLLSALIVLTIALCAVSFQAIKAAMTNPASSLRTE